MSGNGQKEAGGVKVEWWRAGAGPWPSEAARARGERVAAENGAWLLYWRTSCSGCELVDAFPYWRDWFAEMRSVALALALVPMSQKPEEENARWTARRKALLDELLAWDIEAEWCGVLSLARLLPEPEEAESEWGTEELWVEARVGFEGVCGEALGLWQGLAEGGRYGAAEIRAVIAPLLPASGGKRGGAHNVRYPVAMYEEAERRLQGAEYGDKKQLANELLAKYGIRSSAKDPATAFLDSLNKRRIQTPD